MADVQEELSRIEAKILQLLRRKDDSISSMRSQIEALQCENESLEKRVAVLRDQAYGV